MRYELVVITSATKNLKLEVDKTFPTSFAI